MGARGEDPRTPHSNIAMTVLFKHISEHKVITGLECSHRQFNKRSLRSRAFARIFFTWSLRSRAFARIYFRRSLCSSVLYWVASPPNFLRVWKTRSLRSPAIYLVYLSLGGFATEHSLVSIVVCGQSPIQLVINFQILIMFCPFIVRYFDFNLNLNLI